MTITSNDIMNAFLGSIRMHMKILKDAYRVQSLEIAPEPSSLLYLEDDAGAAIRLHLPCDAVIGAHALVNKSWEASRIRFLEQIIPASGAFVLADVGANTGLITRQLLRARKNINAVYAYEPHPGNFDLLQRNLRGVAKVNLVNAGLGPSMATLDFYMDAANAGNYSLNPNAMEAEYSRMPVKILAANDEKNKWLQSGAPIIYKSDTQGFDEVIATSFDPGFWDNVACGCMELWKIKDKTYDKDKFIRVMDKFPHKVFADKPAQMLASTALSDYLSGADGASEDVLFWK